MFPAYRKGPHGDPYKVNCTTCHQGVSKPLGGVSMLDQAPALKGRRMACRGACPRAARRSGDRGAAAFNAPAAMTVKNEPAPTSHAEMTDTPRRDRAARAGLGCGGARMRIRHHPLRAALSEEMHVRRLPRFAAPCRLMQIVIAAGRSECR